MRISLVLVACALLLALSGCGTHSASHQRSKAAEFSEAGFEEEMLRAGKERELEMARQRERAYLNSMRGQGEQQEVASSD
jgi:hypothetical protein